MKHIKLFEQFVNEAVITYGIEYKSSKNDRKFKKASLTKTTHNPNIDKMMITAISKDAKSLAKQDGWVDYRITKDGVPVKEITNESLVNEAKSKKNIYLLAVEPKGMSGDEEEKEIQASKIESLDLFKYDMDGDFISKGDLGDIAKLGLARLWSKPISEIEKFMSSKFKEIKGDISVKVFDENPMVADLGLMGPPFTQYYVFEA